ncbi:MAG: MATE family efflux transporter [Lachnospiraceae bacterium]|nr:MATE family efflux transporter [Lachnospiraceae bacterium]
MKDLSKGNPLKVILQFALPLYIGQLFQLCYGVIDTRVVGSVLGETALAAVGATTALSDLLIEFLNGIICGFGIVIATYFGAKEEKQMKKAIGGTIVIGVLFTTIISVGCLLFLPQILGILNVAPELTQDATAYIQTIIAGLVITALYNIGAVVLRSIGDSFTPLIFLVISNVLNVVLDYSFVMYAGMGTRGAALATVLSQAVSALLCFIVICKKYPSLKLKKEDIQPQGEMYKQLIPKGLSMGFMLSFVMLGSLALQTSINTFGTNTIVAHTAARKITIIFLTPFFVLGTALATYCGQNLGAKEYERIKQGMKSSVLISFAWCIVVVLLIFAFASIFIRFVTGSSEEEIVRTATMYLRINASLYFLPAMICIFRNSMQGFGDTKTPLVSSFIELAGKVLIAWFLTPVIGYWGIIVSEPIVWAVMIIPLFIGLYKGNWFMKG